MSAGNAGCSVIPAILLMGPTASGKTQLALALAERLPVEIVSVDSAQIYRGMDIGTAKPDVEARARVPHHLIDILDPAETYSAARFADDAARIVADIRSRGRVPLLVGGTFLYFRALRQGLSALPEADAELRRQIELEGERGGWGALHARLAALDPQTAQRLHPNDRQRVQRALEIALLSGQRPSDLFAGGAAQASRLGPSLAFALAPPVRAELHRRIELRFAQMMESGLLDEVRRLHARGDLHEAMPAVRAVGYRQLWAHLEGEWTLDEAVARAVAATRRYAKRQLTWLRSESALSWLEAGSQAHAQQAMERILHAHQSAGNAVMNVAGEGAPVGVPQVRL